MASKLPKEQHSAHHKVVSGLLWLVCIVFNFTYYNLYNSQKGISFTKIFF